MIHAICDFCGKDCDRTATLLSMTPFQNFARYHTVYESFSTDSNWIKENAENKWLGCHCLLKDDEYNEYTEMICHLSSDILTMLRNNIFDMISTFNSQGNFDHNYILEN